MMEQATYSFGVLLLAGIGLGMLVLGALGGFLFARNRRTGVAPEPARDPAPSPSRREEDMDDPTAPISPMVSMARSPHDRHRDLAVGNAIVKNIELLEFVLKSGDKQSKENLIQQIRLAKDEFHGLLGNCSFRPFDYAPGTVIDGLMRTRIRIVEGKGGESDRTKIVKTLRCGFLYEAGGDEEPVVIRKAEVEIG